MVNRSASRFLSSPSRLAIRAALLALLGAGLGAQAPAVAAGLGKLSVHSSLGQTLNADIDIPGVEGDEAATLQVRMAPAAAFKEANLDVNPQLAQITLDLAPGAAGSYTVHLSSRASINEPYLDLLLELTWAGGRVLREYTLLLDPPLANPPAPIVPAATHAAEPEPAQEPPAPVSAGQGVKSSTPAEPAPAPVPAPASAPAAAPAPVAPGQAPAQPVAATKAGTSGEAVPAKAARVVHVRSGDTLGHIANTNLADGSSLDQMLVALLQANPSAFDDHNMNRLHAGADLSVPDAAQAQATDRQTAHKQVLTQSADFAAYRSRLAQASQGSAPVAPVASPPAGAGKVTPIVKEKSPSSEPSGDRVSIPAGNPPGQQTTQAKPSLEDNIAKQRAIDEQKKRAEELQKANRDIGKALDQNPAQESPAKTPAAKSVEPPPPPPTKEPTPPVAAPKPAVKTAPPPPQPGFLDRLLTAPVLGAVVAILIVLLVALNVSRRRREASGGLHTDGTDGHSKFGAVGGQSVDTASIAGFSSTFMPPVSQIDANEVDPVSEADVYIAYGREDESEKILKGALLLQPERIPVRVKLLEIYARRGDATSFQAVAEPLQAQTAGQGDDWNRVAKMGRSLDAGNPLYAGETMSPIDMAPLSPLTDLHGEPDPVMGQTVSSSATVPGEFEDDSISHLFGATAMSPRPPRDTASAGLTANTFGDLASTGPADGAAPAPDSGFNFGGLDFDLGPSKLNLDLSTQFPAAEPTVVAPPAPSADPDFPPDDELERTQQSAWPTIMPMPNIDLNLPPPGSQTSEPAHDDDLLFKPTVMSAINAAHPFDEPRLTVNSEQATVPLIDFDLLPTEAGAQGRRTEAQPGSPVASQMETKLDLARGYIDLGVKDGARELLEEVLKDGTREQRQQAVELIKLIDA